jgi:protein O-mannosyl-transferase
MRPLLYKLLLAVAFAVAVTVYWPGLSGNFLFDDYPNIVDNQGVQPHDATVPALVRAAMSSPSSEFKRPLASLSFAANFLTTGLNPYWMKLTNLVVHLLNGWLIFLLGRTLLRAASGRNGASDTSTAAKEDPDAGNQSSIVAALLAMGWMLLPINLTAVLYVVQRMESLANLFVLAGLFIYVTVRSRMLDVESDPPFAHAHSSMPRRLSRNILDLFCCFASITIPTAFGILAKETAAMLPLYAFLIEWILFGFRRPTEKSAAKGIGLARRDYRIIGIFLLVLIVPMIVGLAWLLPALLKPEAWSTRGFTMNTRLLSETRIVVDYIVWTLAPSPDALSFYHDDFRISTGLLTPWTTLASMLVIGGLVALVLWLRRRRPLVALGIALFLGCQLLTGTIIPLELIYEHRNYFASFGLMLAIVPLLAAPRATPFALPRHVLLVGLMLCWTTLTALTAYAWGNPLRLAEDLAARAPQSPRAQYELGRTYIIYSKYDPDSKFTKMAYAPLEAAAALPGSSILPEQALIFMNSRMHLPLKDAWWTSMIAKLTAHKPGVQDESSLGALTQCAHEQHCDLPKQRMMQAYMAALAHPDPSARMLAMYGDYAWNELDDHALGERMTAEAIKVAPGEPAYRITLVRMLVAQRRVDEARAALHGLQALDVGGSLDASVDELRALPGMQ